MWAFHNEAYANDLLHFARLNCPVTIDVIHLERPFQFLFGLSGGCDVDGEKELLEVDLAAVVRVKGPEDVLAELGGVALGKETGIDFEELGSGQLAVRAVLLRGQTGTACSEPNLQFTEYSPFNSLNIHHSIHWILIIPVICVTVAIPLPNSI
jgi:hypothetical protein